MTVHSTTFGQKRVKKHKKDISSGIFRYGNSWLGSTICIHKEKAKNLKHKKQPSHAWVYHSVQEGHTELRTQLWNFLFIYLFYISSSRGYKTLWGKHGWLIMSYEMPQLSLGRLKARGTAMVEMSVSHQTQTLRRTAADNSTSLLAALWHRIISLLRTSRTITGPPPPPPPTRQTIGETSGLQPVSSRTAEPQDQRAYGYARCHGDKCPGKGQRSLPGHSSTNPL